MSSKTLKQLYTESLQKWQGIQSKLNEFDFDASDQFKREYFWNEIYELYDNKCSFCQEYSSCYKCKIKTYICCNSGLGGLFNDINFEDEDTLKKSITAMVSALQKELEVLEQ